MIKYALAVNKVKIIIKKMGISRLLVKNQNTDSHNKFFEIAMGISCNYLNSFLKVNF